MEPFKKKQNLVLTTVPHIDVWDDAVNGIFTRAGGVSTGPFASLNISRSVGDAPAAVRQNRARIKECFNADHLVFAHQVHGNRVLRITAETIRRLNAPDAPVLEGDALITNIPGVFLGIQVADCQPVLLFDPRQRIIANIHAGWRGSVLNIIRETITIMKTTYNSRPADIRAGIGPSLGPCCAEFIHYRQEIPEHLWSYKNQNDCFDFWSISADQLKAEGVPADHIHTSGLCTRCHPDIFFSYRAEKTTGRFPAVIGLSRKR